MGVWVCVLPPVPSGRNRRQARDRRGREVGRHQIRVALDLAIAAGPGPGCMPGDRARGRVHADASLAIAVLLAPEVVVQGELASADSGVLLTGICALVVQDVPGPSGGCSKREGKDGVREIHGGWFRERRRVQ